MFMRGSSKAAQDYTLLLKKKPPTVNKQIMIPPKLRPKKYVGCSFQNFFDTDVKIVQIGCQVSVCVNKWHKKCNFWVKLLSKVQLRLFTA